MYFEARPVGWRDDMRFARIMQSLGIKAKPEEMFRSISQVKLYEVAPEKGTEASDSSGDFNANAFKSSGLFGALLRASGGDRPTFME